MNWGPVSFSATESGVELKILRKICSPEEAEMALTIRPLLETLEQIAEQVGKACGRDGVDPRRRGSERTYRNYLDDRTKRFGKGGSLL